ncbi:MAG: hypothetical protein HXY40_09615 [Chloroflexi bacterium]|nr:hypothetical protein [Chloroflexota bacterium]
MADDKGKPNQSPASSGHNDITIASELRSPLGNVPWTLEQFFKGKIDLDKELVMRFPNMPLMSVIGFRSLGSNTQRGVATLSTADGGANLVVDASASGERTVQFSFTYGSMLTLRFRLDTLSDMDRSRFLDLMRRNQPGLTFLWGQSRWEQDYLICVTRKHYTSLLAFSRNHFEAAVRLTPNVTKQLVDWIENFWKAPPEEEPPQLLTW